MAKTSGYAPSFPLRRCPACRFRGSKADLFFPLLRMVLNLFLQNLNEVLKICVNELHAARSSNQLKRRIESDPEARAPAKRQHSHNPAPRKPDDFENAGRKAPR